MSNRGGERRRSRSRSRGREPGREGGDNRDRRGDSRTRDDGFQDRRGGFQERRGDDRGYQERRTDDRGYQDRGDGDRYSGSKRTREEGEEPEGPSRGFRGGDRDRGGRGFERDNRNTGGNSYGDRDDRGNGGRSYGDRDDRGGGGRGYGGGDRNNNDNGGRFGGGRGRGGFDGGRGRDGGRGGGGRGGRGGKKSMADVDAIVSLIKTGPNANDAACLKIIETPTDLKTREQHIENIEATGKHKYYKQPVEAWRLSRSLGISLDNSSHVVRGNCYRVNPQFLPPKIYHYYVSIFRFNRDGELTQEDLCKEKDATLCVGVVRNIIEKNPEWKSDINDKPIGLAYDGRSSLYSSTMIPFNMNGPKEDNLRWQGEINWPVHSPTTYLVLLSLAKDIDIPRTQEDWKKNKDMTALQALDIALISFAKWETAESHPRWIIAGSKVFKSDGVSYDFGKAYLGRLGYFFSLKACMAGLVLQTDVSVNCFAKGGKFIELMALIAGYSSVDEMARSTSNDSYGLQRDRLEKIEETLRNWKIRLLHVGHTKSFKRFGPPANHPDSQFTSEDGSTVTVAQYYQSKASNETYAKFLTGGKLKYPNLPTINAGNKNKQILIPVELVEIVPGQSKTTGLPSDISSNIIKYAAMLPADRFKYIDRESQKSGVLHELLTNRNTIAFGFDRIELTPIKSSAFILPPPKLQYKNRVIEPELKGAWNLAGGVKFIHPPPFNDNASNSSSYLYGIICVYRSGSSKPYGIDHMMDQFVQQLETESRNVGIPLQNCSRPHYVDSSPESLNEICSDLKKKGARIMVVLLHFDAYADVKYAADKLCLPSQCVRWKNVQTPPRNYAASLLVKMNYKMGGVNHTLTSRLPNNHDHSMEKEDCFQSPPKSISWLFDEPCMVIGLDINHPERGGPTSANAKTIISMVASMDGMMGQFAAHISVCHNKENPVNELERGISQLLTTFSHRNQGRVPRHILVYRDGVADNQFDEIVEKELVAFKNAYNLRGYDEGYVKMAIIVCQKRHHSRFVYDFGKGASEGDPEYLNPCVGLCIDGRCAYQGSGNGDNPDPIGSITSPNVNEFYLNSHAAILGTSKLCKYSLIYDEIGLEMVELELLTFWSTHLYCRCTKAVSCASPACYARFAAKRGGYLQRAGCSDEELAQMSENWLKAEQIPSVYFA